MVDIVVSKIRCRTAKKFLDAISPIGKHFGNKPFNSPWLFRGQGQDWPLVPSIFRKDPYAQKKLKALTKRDITNNYSELLLAERDFLVDFFAIADKQGFIIPDDSQDLRESLDSVRLHHHTVRNDDGNWLMSGKILSLAASAQHYGIPTRLLDWSLQSLIAAFFAAEGGIKRYDEDKKEFNTPNSPLVVWAFHFPLFGVKTSWVENSFSIKGITAPGASNPNLKAQQGVFTLIHSTNIDTNEKNSDYLPFDTLIKNIASGGRSRDVEGCKLHKFTVPVTESFELLRLLARLDITPSSIYPGYHSIISDMENQGKWERFLSL